MLIVALLLPDNLMKESHFLGSLLPSHSDFLPIEEAIRKKYAISEISPGDEEIAEIFLRDEIVPLEEFQKDIEKHIRENLCFIPRDLLKLYLPAKAFLKLNTKHDAKQNFLLPEDLKKQSEAIIKFTETIMCFVVQMLDPMQQAVGNLLHYLLRKKKKRMSGLLEMQGMVGRI